MSVVPNAVPAASARTRTWLLPLVRGVLALVLGLTITFTPAHTAGFGLVAFGAFAVLGGAAIVALALVGLVAPWRTTFLVQGVVTVLAGAGALVLPGGGEGYLVWVVSAWAIVTGALELVSGIRARGRLAGARDWVLVGAVTLLLGVAYLVVPPGYTQQLGGLEQVPGDLTASVILVGALGAWAIVVGVLLAISAVSLRGEARPRGSRETS